MRPHAGTACTASGRMHSCMQQRSDDMRMARTWLKGKPHDHAHLGVKRRAPARGCNTSTPFIYPTILSRIQTEPHRIPCIAVFVCPTSRRPARVRLRCVPGTPSHALNYQHRCKFHSSMASAVAENQRWSVRKPVQACQSPRRTRRTGRAVHADAQLGASRFACICRAVK